MFTYKVCYNHGYNNSICAVTYVEAKDFSEAYAFAEAQRSGRERIHSVNVFEPIKL